MKKILIISSILFTYAFGFANQGIDRDKIKIGSFLPLSGPVGFIGDGFRVGAETYIKYYNKEIKYLGKILEAKFIDDGFVAEKSLQATKELMEIEKIFAIVGAVGTPGIVASMEHIVKKGIPFVYQGSGVSHLYLPPKRNVFPIQPSFIFETRVMVKFLSDSLHKKRISVVYRNDEIGDGVLQGLTEILPDYKRKGVVIIEKIPVASTESDFTPIITRLKNGNSDAVIFYLLGGQAVGFVKSVREAGMDLNKVSFITSYINGDPIMFKLAGNIWNDIYIGAWASPATKEYVNHFERIWKKYSGLKSGPSPYNIAGWIAMETFAEGLKRTVKKYGSNLNWENFIQSMETFHENGGWSDGMTYKISYKPFQKGDKTCRFPQAFLYFVKSVNKEYQLYKKTNSLKELFISAY